MVSDQKSKELYSIEVDYQVKEKDAEIINNGLEEFNASFFGNKKLISFAVFLKDKDKIVGGVLAWIRPEIKLLYIDTMWVDGALRNRGYGTKLLLTTEAEGIRQGCNHAQLDTLPFVAEGFYKKLGYFRIGLVEKLFGEYDYIFMRKYLRNCAKIT